MLQTETERSTSPPSGARWIIVGLLGFGLAMVALLYVLPRPAALRLLDERGPMEMVSLSIYALAVVSLAFMLRTRPSLTGWAMAALLFLAVSEYNPGNVMTNWIEVEPPIPGDPVGVNRIGVAAISLIVLGILAGLLASARSRFLAGLRHGELENWLALMGGLLLPIAFFIDRIQASRFNWHRGYRLEKGIFYASDVVEETLEFLMPFFFFFAILLWSRRRKRREITS
jgi:hypothetical protein